MAESHAFAGGVVIIATSGVAYHWPSATGWNTVADQWLAIVDHSGTVPGAVALMRWERVVLVHLGDMPPVVVGAPAAPQASLDESAAAAGGGGG